MYVYKMRRGQTGDSCPVSHRDLSQHNKKKTLAFGVLPAKSSKISLG